MAADDILEFLTTVFQELDAVVEGNGMYRIKTIGHIYMCSVGVPEGNPNHQVVALHGAIEMIERCHKLKIAVIDNEPVELTIGLNSGSLIAAVIGINRLAFDLFGDVVNVASRLSTNCIDKNCIQMRKEVFEDLPNKESFVTSEHIVNLKGKGEVECVRVHGFLADPKDKLDEPPRLKTSESMLLAKIKQRLLSKKLTMEDPRKDKESEEYCMQFSCSNEYQNLPLSAMADCISLPPMNYSPKKLKTKIIWRSLAMLKNTKLYSLFIQYHYKNYVNLNRLLFCNLWICSVVFLLLDFCHKTIHDDLEGKNISEPSWFQIILWRLIVGGSIVFLSNVWIFTPFYSKNYLFNFIFCILGISGQAIANALSVIFIGPSFHSVSLFLLIFIHLFAIRSIPFLLRLFGLLIVTIIVTISMIFGFFDSNYEFNFESMVVSLTKLGAFVLIALIALINSHYESKYECFEFFLQGLNLKKQRLCLQTRKQNDLLLRSMLPMEIIPRLQDNVAEYFEDASILYSDICSFTQWVSSRSPMSVIHTLNLIFTEFEIIARRHNLINVKTIGDNFVVCGGLQKQKAHHQSIVHYAIEALHFVKKSLSLQFRFGIHCGSMMAGVLTTKPQNNGRLFIQYEVLGKTVTAAEVYESLGLPGKIHISSKLYHRLDKSKFFIEKRESLISHPVFDEPQQSYFVEGKQTLIAENRKLSELKTKLNERRVSQIGQSIQSYLRNNDDNWDTLLIQESGIIPGGTNTNQFNDQHKPASEDLPSAIVTIGSDEKPPSNEKFFPIRISPPFRSGHKFSIKGSPQFPFFKPSMDKYQQRKNLNSPSNSPQRDLLSGMRELRRIKPVHEVQPSKDGMESFKTNLISKKNLSKKKYEVDTELYLQKKNSDLDVEDI